jgi:hypothetical protein
VGLQPQPGRIYYCKTSRGYGGSQDPVRVVPPVKKKKKKKKKMFRTAARCVCYQIFTVFHVSECNDEFFETKDLCRLIQTSTTAASDNPLRRTWRVE